MTDVSEMTDAELMAHYAMPRLIKQESGGRAGVLGPQTAYGRAEGMTQMLPATAQATAKRIGVNWQPELMRGNSPEAAAYQEQLGRAYLQEGIEKTGDLKGGLKYYHGGPNEKLWGPKTNGYAEAISADLGVGDQAQPNQELASLTDDQLMAMYQAPSAGLGGAMRKPIGGGLGGGGGSPAPRAAPAPRVAPRQLPQRQPKVSQALGFAKGVQDPVLSIPSKLDMVPGANMKLGGMADLPRLLSPFNAMQVAGKYAKNLQTGMLADQAKKGVVPGKIGEFAGNVAGTAFLPGGPLASGAVGGVLLSNAKDAKGLVRDAAVGAAASKAGDMAIKGLSKVVGGLLSKSPKVLTPAEITTARDTAYQAVDNAGVQYTPQAVDDLISGMSDEMRAAKINPLRHPKAASMLEEITSLEGSSPTLTELDQLRQVIRRDVASASDPAEAFFGQKMIKNLDEFINAAGPNQVVAGDAGKAAETIATARKLNTQLKKIEGVEEAVYKAGNRAAGTGSGGNIDNATRQNLRRFLETTKNLTDDERKAIEGIVRGGKVQNFTRLLGKLSPQGSGLMTALGIGGTMANPILGIPALVGTGSKAIADSMTQKGVSGLLDLLAAGGSKASLKPVPTPASKAAQKAIPKLAPAVSAASAALAVGATQRLPQKPKQRR